MSPFFTKNLVLFIQKLLYIGFRKPVFGEKSAQEAFFEGLKSNFLSDMTLLFLLKMGSTWVKVQLVKKFKDLIILSV